MLGGSRNLAAEHDDLSERFINADARRFVKIVDALLQQTATTEILIPWHPDQAVSCWRTGLMREASVNWRTISHGSPVSS